MSLLNEKINESYNALIDHLSTTQVLLLHPRSKYRSVAVAMLINDPEHNTYYYALGPDDINLKTFVEGMAHDLANQHPTFGRHLNLLPSHMFEDFESHADTILEKFALELNELNQDSFSFILDEYDRSDMADDIHRFIEYLAGYLPAQCCLVINSRTLPRLPWVALIAKNQATLLLDTQVIERDFYSAAPSDEYDLEIYAIGPGYVLNNGQEIQSWEGHLPRLLFFFALDKPVVTRSEICNAFWPELENDQAVNVFHVTKRRLHKALGIDVLVHEDSHYRVNPQLSVYYDVMDFVENLARARHAEDSDTAFQAWQRAVELYRGAFLQGHQETWIDERREAFRQGYLEALTQIAEIWISKDRKEIALKVYRQALDEDFHRQDIHRDMMQLYSDLGRRSEAVAHFQQMEKTFAERDVVISDETTNVYNAIVS